MLNRAMRRKKKLTPLDLLAMGDDIMKLSHEEQLAMIHKANPHWEMPDKPYILEEHFPVVEKRLSEDVIGENDVIASKE